MKVRQKVGVALILPSTACIDAFADRLHLDIGDQAPYPFAAFSHHSFHCVNLRTHYTSIIKPKSIGELLKVRLGRVDFDADGISILNIKNTKIESVPAKKMP